MNQIICGDSLEVLKTTRGLAAVPQRVKRTDKYLFHVRRCGKGGRRSYTQSEVDVFALVALDTKTIGYLKASDTKQTMFFLPEGTKNIKDVSDRNAEIKRLRNSGKKYKEISESLDVDIGYAHRVVSGKESKTYSSRTLSSYLLESCLK